MTQNAPIGQQGVSGRHGNDTSAAAPGGDHERGIVKQVAPAVPPADTEPEPPTNNDTGSTDDGGQLPTLPKSQ